ncbi:MAG: hypothetical protein LBD47_11090 [Treponema sp.]|jgi:hypothetical protein|nr:hypothetical protein [Treponema sp.]
MKTYGFVLIVCAALFPAGCDSGGGGEGIFPALPSQSGYTLQFPAVPPAWSLLGSPSWRLEWLSPAGEKETATIRDGKRPEISLPETWTSPVIAWPHWPDKGIGPGVFKPAGALFPFDVSGGNMALSWRGGVDAVLYWELAAADTDAARAAVPRLPQNFNWPRFRDLFTEEGGINADVLGDPWLADWASIAAKIVQSGFDKRRLTPEARKELPVPAGPGPWIGVSPFSEPLLFEGQPVFRVRETPDTWVSAEGLLRCTQKTWIFLPWD